MRICQWVCVGGYIVSSFDILFAIKIFKFYFVLSTCGTDEFGGFAIGERRYGRRTTPWNNRFILNMVYLVSKVNAWR